MLGGIRMPRVPPAQTPRRKGLRVASFQHGGNPDNRQHHRGSRDHTDASGHDSANEDCRYSKATAKAAEPQEHSLIQLLGHAGSLQHGTHEYEEGDRKQDVVGRLVEHPGVVHVADNLRTEQKEADDEADRAHRDG